MHLLSLKTFPLDLGVHGLWLGMMVSICVISMLYCDIYKFSLYLIISHVNGLDWNIYLVRDRNLVLETGGLGE